MSLEKSMIIPIHTFLKDIDSILPKNNILIFSDTKEDLDKRLKEIWETYLSPDADTEICISDIMRARTRVRMNLVHLYGAGWSFYPSLPSFLQANP